ncbi:MAG: HNH endonuclease [Gammaproteobacteria bacterium]|nr:HNH endonuclease [Gammaproteobacteria bacterium]
MPNQYRTFETVEERFFSKVAFGHGPGACWAWKAGLNSRGYGLFWTDNAQHLVHRISYEWCVEPIPEGLTIDHLCRNRACVNPAHMEPVTDRENVRRGECFSAVNARKTHCPQGHPYAGENLYVKPNGNRICRICSRKSRRVASRIGYEGTNEQRSD